MSVFIYHQVGHNAVWNIDSFTKDNAGDGLIFSPVHQNIKKIEECDVDIKIKSIFDPQYYLPNSQKKKLLSYHFHPEALSGGFSTVDFPMMASESAQQCIDFQISNNFEKIIIPVRYFSQMKTDYIELQEEFSVLPFLKVIENSNIDKPVFLTLALTSHMIEDKGFKTRILNWITSFPIISGVYILVSHERSSKQIQSEEFLNAFLDFMMILKEVDLDIIVGHTNTESLLYSLIDGITLSFGSFENTRIFSIDKFIESDEERRGPKARIFLPGLLNWVQWSQAKEIMTEEPDIWRRIYQSTKYGDESMLLNVEPHFSNARLYKHFFISYYDLIQELSALNGVDRFNKIKHYLEEAQQNHNKIKSMPLNLDVHGNGDHIEPWINVINRYYRKHLK